MIERIEEMRVDKYLSHAGYGSRKEVKQLLKKATVTVNGQRVKDPKVHVNEAQDHVIVNGEEIIYQDTLYIMLNKPKGVISATEDNFQKTVIDLLDSKDQLLNPFPVGRLDKDTEGLLLITNDGELSHRLLSPRHHVPKTYEAEISGEVTLEDVKRFQQGVTLDDGYHTKPAELIIHQSESLSFVTVVVTEGKFHQVKRMFQAVDKQVISLKRTKMGPLNLDPSLQKGSYRFLSDQEVAQLKSL